MEREKTIIVIFDIVFVIQAGLPPSSPMIGEPDY
jgi:hypothetical protein